MEKGKKKERNLLALTGVAALAAVTVNVAIFTFNSHRKKRKSKNLPGSSVCANLSAREITELADRIIAKSKETYDMVASVPIEKVTYVNAILPLAELEAKQFPMMQSCIFPKMVSVSVDVRRASAEAERKLDSHFSLCRKREDVYHVIKAFHDRGELLKPEAKHFVECLVRDFERNGVLLNLNKRKELDSLKSQIDDLTFQYIENLNGDSSALLFNGSELAGMPLEFIKNLEKSENGKLKVFVRSNHVSAILEHCKVGSTRKLVALTHGQRCGKDNLRILENLVQLRHQFAEKLGYSSYADYACELRMAKTSTKIFQFLEDLSHNLTDLATRELDMLKDLKQREEGGSPFGMEDMLYYMRRAEEIYLDLDYDVINQLFSLDLVLLGILKIFQDLFGLRFDEIKDVEVWHDSVRVFSVFDVSCNELLGYFYLDMFSRDGKYAHTCVLALQNGCMLSDGTRQVPVALLISQFYKKIDDNSESLKFSQAVRLIHEFIHVVHQMCNRASFSRFSGLHIDADFIEIPGKMIENWCYESSFLRLLSGFSQDKIKSITTEICKVLKKRRDSFSGLKLKQEILLCIIDQIVNSSENVDIVGLVKHIHPKVMLGIPLLEGTNPASCFPHLAIGNDASCYSYLWSEVFAADIFFSKFQNDLMNQYTGLHFRNKIFAPGGSRDALEMVEDYLGRESSIHAFVESKMGNSLANCF